jgi:valyl-tRNA synthetase
MPYVTSEVWSWFNNNNIHFTSWAKEISIKGNKDLFLISANMLFQIRKIRSKKQISIKVPIAELNIQVDNIKNASLVKKDVELTGNVSNLVFEKI